MSLDSLVSTVLTVLVLRMAEKRPPISHNLRIVYSSEFRARKLQ